MQQDWPRAILAEAGSGYMRVHYTMLPLFVNFCKGNFLILGHLPGDSASMEKGPEKEKTLRKVLADPTRLPTSLILD